MGKRENMTIAQANSGLYSGLVKADGDNVNNVTFTSDQDKLSTQLATKSRSKKYLYLLVLLCRHLY